MGGCENNDAVLAASQRIALFTAFFELPEQFVASAGGIVKGFWTLDKLTLNLQGNALRLDFAPIMITLLPGTDFNQKLPN
jgi:hypothetical protein